MSGVKRVLSLICTLALVLTMMPFSAFAESAVGNAVTDDLKMELIAENLTHPGKPAVPGDDIQLRVMATTQGQRILALTFGITYDGNVFSAVNKASWNSDLDKTITYTIPLVGEKTVSYLERKINPGKGDLQVIYEPSDIVTQYDADRNVAGYDPPRFPADQAVEVARFNVTVNQEIGVVEGSRDFVLETHTFKVGHCIPKSDGTGECLENDLGRNVPVEPSVASVKVDTKAPVITAEAVDGAACKGVAVSVDDNTAAVTVNGAARKAPFTLTEVGDYTVNAVDEAGNQAEPVTVSVKAHSLQTVAQKPHTCTEDGHREYYLCTVCGQKFADAAGTAIITDQEILDPAAHTLEKIGQKDATCTDDGTEEYWRCSVCHKLFSDAQGANEIDAPAAIPAKGHQLKAVQEILPTCTTEGTKAYWVCSVCHKLFSDAQGTNEIDAPESVSALGHTLTRTDGFAATCTEDGLEAYYTCSVCQKLFSDAQGQNEIKEPIVISKLGHDLEKIEKTEATCTSDGEEEHWHCARCDELFSDAEGTVSVTKAQLVIPAIQHKNSIHHEAVEPSCAPGAIEYWECPDCGRLFADAGFTKELSAQDIAIPATGKHLLTEVAHKAHTKDDPGNIQYWECSVCGNRYSDSEGTQLVTDVTDPHVLQTTEAKAPTCTENGNIAYAHCSVCDQYFDAENQLISNGLAGTVIKATGHAVQYVEPVPSDLCTQTGQIGYYYCKNDNCPDHGQRFAAYDEAKDLLSDPVADLDDHTYGPHKTTAHQAVAATCTKEGTRAYWTCDVCGKLFSDAEGRQETNSEAIRVQPLGHHAVKKEEVPSTCKEHGTAAYWYCDRETGCELSGRKFADSALTQERTDEQLQLALAPHTLQKVEKAAPTCTEAGHEEYWKCSVCGKLFEDANGAKETTLEGLRITALGHEYGDLIPQKDPTYESAGTAAHYQCSRCGELFDEQKNPTTAQALVIPAREAEVTAGDQGSLQMSSDDIKAAIFDQNELAGASMLQVNLNVSQVSSVPEKDSTAVAQKLGKKADAFFDITIEKTVVDSTGASVQQEVHNPSGDVKVGIRLPANLVNTNPDVIRNYDVVRVHEENGVTTYDRVACEFVGGANPMLVVTSNKYSVFAVSYTDTAVQKPAASGAAGSAAAPAGNEYTVCEACGHQHWTWTAEGYRCDNCGHLTLTVKGPEGVKGYVGNSIRPAAAQAAQSVKKTTIPQTSDDFPYALLAVLSGISLLGILVSIKKRKQN